MGTYIRRTLALWQSDDDGGTADRITSSTGALVGVGVVLCLVVLFTAVTFGELGGAWLSGSWHSFWSIANSPLRFYWFFPLINLFSARVSTRAAQQPHAPRVRELRQATLDGDATRAPVARKQPIAFAAGELPTIFEIVPRLRPLVTAPTNWRRRASISALTLATLVGGSLGVLLICIWSDMAMAGGEGDPYGALLTVCLAIGILVWIPSVAVLLTGGIVLMRRAPRTPQVRRGSIDVAVSPWEVRWITPTRPREEQRIAWEDVRAFYQISYRSLKDYTRHATYFLDSGATLLAWEISGADSPELLAAHERFLRIIATYTCLTLRDLSNAAQELGTALWAPKVMAQAERSAALRAAREARRNRPRRRTRPNYAVVAGITAFVTLLATPIVAGWRLQGIQPSYYNAIAARALARGLLFTDMLAKPDGRWPIKAPDGGHDPSYTYQGGGYQIGGGPANDIAYATLSTTGGDPATYGDAAIEVTARESGSSDTGGVGLILRDVKSGANEDFVDFWVSTDGGWSLERFSGDASDPNGWAYLASSDEYSSGSPVHAGPGATNIILVVMRGDEIICFVNGQFVTAARDSGIPASGRVGVYLNDSADTGIFNDFSVYPAA